MNCNLKIIPGPEYEFEYGPFSASDMKNLLRGTSVLSFGIDDYGNEDESIFLDVSSLWIEKVWAELKIADASLNPFMFLFDSSSQVATRIVRYKRLWKAFKQKYPDLIDLEKSSEEEFLSGNRVRYAGLSLLEERNFIYALDHTRQHRNCCIFALPSDRFVDLAVLTAKLFNVVFLPGNSAKGDAVLFLNWPILIHEVVSLGGVGLKAVGNYGWGGYYLDIFFANDSVYARRLLYL